MEGRFEVKAVGRDGGGLAEIREEERRDTYFTWWAFTTCMEVCRVSSLSICGVIMMCPHKSTPSNLLFFFV